MLFFLATLSCNALRFCFIANLIVSLHSFMPPFCVAIVSPSIQSSRVYIITTARLLRQYNFYLIRCDVCDGRAEFDHRIEKRRSHLGVLHICNVYNLPPFNTACQSDRISCLALLLSVCVCILQVFSLSFLLLFLSNKQRYLQHVLCPPSTTIFDQQQVSITFRPLLYMQLIMPPIQLWLSKGSNENKHDYIDIPFAISSIYIYRCLYMSC